MYYVYILQSQKDSDFYTGLAKNVSRRLQEHNGGHVKPTKGRRPLKLVYTEKLPTLAEARAREKFFKTGIGREYRDKILKKIIFRDTCLPAGRAQSRSVEVKLNNIPR